jgi:DNA-binding IclR family transcriptional regulator
MAHSELVQSLSRGLRIITVLAASDEGLALRDVSETMGLKPPTAHNLLRTLCAEGFAAKHDGRYTLGPAIRRISTGGAGGEWRARADDVVRSLFRKIGGATVSLAEAAGDDISVSVRISPERPGLVEHPRGESMHPYGTGTALVFQAFWREEVRAAYRARHRFWEYGAHLWDTEERLEKTLSRIRRRGYTAEKIRGRHTLPVAAPVFSRSNQLIGVIGAGIPQKERTARRKKRCIDAVLAAARDLSKHA